MNTYRENRSRAIEMPLMPMRAMSMRLAKANRGRGCPMLALPTRRDASPAMPAVRRRRTARLSACSVKPTAFSKGPRKLQSTTPNGWRMAAAVCRAKTPMATIHAEDRALRGRMLMTIRATKGSRRIAWLIGLPPSRNAAQTTIAAAPARDHRM